MNKCKYCNSENLILEPQVKGQDVMTANVVALKCGNCGKWLKWCPKDERKYHFQSVKQNKEVVHTNDIASNTQKAFKEGYEKATIDRGNEIAELNAENAILKIKYEALKAGKSVASSIARVPNEINERIIKSKAVKEFAEKLKETVFDYLGVKTIEEADKLSLFDSTLTYDVVTDRIDELLKEYEK